MTDRDDAALEERLRHHWYAQGGDIRATRAADITATAQPSWFARWGAVAALAVVLLVGATSGLAFAGLLGRDGGGLLAGATGSATGSASPSPWAAATSPALTSSPPPASVSPSPVPTPFYTDQPIPGEYPPPGATVPPVPCFPRYQTCPPMPVRSATLEGVTIADLLPIMRGLGGSCRAAQAYLPDDPRPYYGISCSATAKSDGEPRIDVLYFTLQGIYQIGVSTPGTSGQPPTSVSGDPQASRELFLKVAGLPFSGVDRAALAAWISANAGKDCSAPFGNLDVDLQTDVAGNPVTLRITARLPGWPRQAARCG